MPHCVDGRVPTVRSRTRFLIARQRAPLLPGCGGLPCGSDGDVPKRSKGEAGKASIQWFESTRRLHSSGLTVPSRAPHPRSCERSAAPMVGVVLGQVPARAVTPRA